MKALDYLLARPEALPPDRTNFHGPEVQELSGGQCGVHQENILIDESIHTQFKEHFFDLRAGAAITWQTCKFDVAPKRNC